MTTTQPTVIRLVRFITNAKAIKAENAPRMVAKLDGETFRVVHEVKPYGDRKQFLFRNTANPRYGMCGYHNTLKGLVENAVKLGARIVVTPKGAKR